MVLHLYKKCLLASVAVLVLSARPGWAAAERWKTFVDSTTGFSLQYPGPFQAYRKEDDESVLGGIHWKACNSEHLHACLIMEPDALFPDSTFRGAAVAVSVLAPSDLMEICPPLDPSQAASRGTHVVNGVTYDVYDAGISGGMNKEGDEIYRTPHGGNCFQIDLQIAWYSYPEGFNPGDIKEFTKENQVTVINLQKKILGSLKFLK